MFGSNFCLFFCTYLKKNSSFLRGKEKKRAALKRSKNFRPSAVRPSDSPTVRQSDQTNFAPVRPSDRPTKKNFPWLCPCPTSDVMFQWFMFVGVIFSVIYKFFGYLESVKWVFLIVTKIDIFIYYFIPSVVQWQHTGFQLQLQILTDENIFLINFEGHDFAP